MIILNATTDKISLITSAAATIDVHASTMDYDGTTVTPGRKNTAISTATTTDISGSPSSSHQLNIKTLHIRNKDASLSCDVTVQFDQNGTLYQLHKVTLATGDALEYIEGVGFFTLTATSKLNTKLRVSGSDYVNATTTFSDITGLSVAVKTSKFYGFLSHLYHVNNATTTGSQFGVNGPAMSAIQIADINVVTTSPTAAALSAGQATALDTVPDVQTTGSTTTRLGILSGYFNPSADGTFVIRGKSEVAVAAGLTVKVGSWMHVWEFDN